MPPFSEGWTEKDVEDAIARNDPGVMIHVPILVSLNPPDCVLAQGICLRLASHENEQIRANAIRGFGHLARLCGALDEAAVRPLVEAVLKDPSSIVRGQADAAASDINHFLSWDPPLPLPPE